MNGRVFVENGLRKVTPYYKDSRVYCKGRWFGRTVRDVLVSEFKFYPQEYIVRGRIPCFLFLPSWIFDG